MPALALAIGEPAEGEEIGRVEQRTPSERVEPLARLDFLGDVRQTGGERRGSVHGH